MLPASNKKNLVVVDFGFKTGKVFAPLFDQISIYRQSTQIDRNSVVIFEGGSDINPSLYNESKGTWTHSINWKRDELETYIFNFARYRQAAFIGICRGAQLITALAGGGIFQDVTGHNETHTMRTLEGDLLSTTSLHHQMMNPFQMEESEYKVLAWAVAPLRGLEALSTHYLSGENKTEFVPEKEPEVVWYPKIKALCIQGHPEFSPHDGRFPQYCRDLVSTYILQQE